MNGWSDNCARAGCGNARESHYQSRGACLCRGCPCEEYVPPRELAATSVFVLLLVAACSTWTQTGSVTRSPCTHVGVRPVDLTYVDDESDGYGLSLRVSTDAPVCREVYREGGMP